MRASVLVLLLFMAAVASAAAAERLALVIGNASYAGAMALRNPANDAADIGTALTELGFHVSELVDARLEPMNQAHDAFLDRIEWHHSQDRKVELALFFYAGHAVQYRGTNYLIPLQAGIERPSDLPYRAVDVQQLLDAMQTTASQVNLVILDACRNNPFTDKRAFRQRLRTLDDSSWNGLAQMPMQRGALIAFATAPGEVAEDGDGRNGTYTHHLLQQLTEPGLTLFEAFNKTGRAVVHATDSRQIPWINASPLPDICLAGCGRDTAATRRLFMGETRRHRLRPGETARWVFDGRAGEALTLTQHSQFDASLQVLEPSGQRLPTRLLGRSNDRYTKLGLSLASGGPHTIVVAGQKGSSAGAYRLTLAADETPPPRQPNSSTEPSSQSGDLPARYTEPTTHLEFVLIQGDTFQMGSPAGELERDSDETLHRIEVEDFYVSTTEVTFSAYDRFAKATGRHLPNAEGWGRGRRPVINVSWQDARAFAAWLSRQTGAAYRLPTEAEWEYAARAGTRTPYWWGRDSGHDRANCSRCGSRWDGRQTAPVASFPANPWGLFDTAGNVWEWTCSRFDPSYKGAENRCAQDSHGDRVFRGGSWRFRPERLRVANRLAYSPKHRAYDLGFRLARDLQTGP